MANDRLVRLSLSPPDRDELPPLCLVTGKAAEHRRLRWSHAPSWTFWTLLFGVSSCIAARLWTRKKLRLELPFTPWVLFERVAVPVVTTLALLSGGALWLILLILVFTSLGQPPLHTMAATFALTVVAGAGVWRWRRLPSIKQIEGDHVILKVPNEQVLKAIRAHQARDASGPAAVADETPCPVHAGEPAVATCDRCGGFLCDVCVGEARAAPRRICRSCLALLQERAEVESLGLVHSHNPHAEAAVVFFLFGFDSFGVGYLVGVVALVYAWRRVANDRAGLWVTVCASVIAAIIVTNLVLRVISG